MVGLHEALGASRPVRGSSVRWARTRRPSTVSPYEAPWNGGPGRGTICAVARTRHCSEKLTGNVAWAMSSAFFCATVIVILEACVGVASFMRRRRSRFDLYAKVNLG